MLLSASAAFAVSADTDDYEAQQMEIELGREFANKEFYLKTDAGIQPEAFTADENGNLTLAVGGSSRYKVVYAESVAENSTEQENETTAETETETETETVDAETEPDSEQDVSGEKTKGILIRQSVIFGGGIVVCIVYLILSRRKKKSPNNSTDDFVI